MRFFSHAASRLLSPERAALRESGLATGGLAKDGRATGTNDDGLGVREDGGDGEAAGALDVHEERAGRRHKSLERKRKIQNQSTDLGGCGVREDGDMYPHTLSLCLRASA